jgi:transcriptional regulator NrdR family protein
MATNQELEASNLLLLATLNEAIDLIHHDVDSVKLRELREVVETHRKYSERIYKQLQIDTIAALRFPTMLRKMWSGQEVQSWLEEQADQKLK